MTKRDFVGTYQPNQAIHVVGQVQRHRWSLLTCLAFVTREILCCKAVLSLILIRTQVQSISTFHLRDLGGFIASTKISEIDLVASDTETNDVATIAINRCDQPHDIETNNLFTKKKKIK
ncbi:hypothetical protein YC2023_013448 [Brassica napus]